MEINWTFTTQMICQAIQQGIETALPEYQERRRYALLQAAATIDSGDGMGSNPYSVGESVSRAEELLREIEKREREADARWEGLGKRETVTPANSTPLLTVCKLALLAIKHLNIAADPEKERLAIYRMLQEAVQEEERNS
jgi:hypothetical protein